MCEKPWRDDHPMQIVFKVGSRGEKLPTPPPEACEPELREMIVECFADDPNRRPDFKKIVEKLEIMCHRVDTWIRFTRMSTSLEFWCLILMNFRIVIFSIMIQNGCTIIPMDYPATVIQRLLSGFQIRSLDVLTVIVRIRSRTA